MDSYGTAIPIEGCGFEYKRCCMQQKRCIASMSHAAVFFHQNNIAFDHLSPEFMSVQGIAQRSPDESRRPIVTQF